MLNPTPLQAERRSDTQARRVAVSAPGRLHLGFLDPSASLGRRWGSVGLVIDDFATEVELGPAARDQFSAAPGVASSELERARRHLECLRAQTGLGAPLALHLPRVLPAHAGLGSGTQLALAVGRAFARWHGLELPTARLAQWLARGSRSGIGIAGFDQGGLLVDGGIGDDGLPAPIVARSELPAAWRVLLLLDAGRSGLAGAAERDAIVGLPALPRALAAELCHQVLMRVLPGAATADHAAFAAGVNRVQALLGEHFAPAQGGSAWTSPAIARAMQWVGAQYGDAAAIGQSSWGPTAFAILPSAAAAAALEAGARAAGVIAPALELRTVAARNRGAVLRNDPHPGPLPEGEGENGRTRWREFGADR